MGQTPLWAVVVARLALLTGHAHAEDTAPLPQLPNGWKFTMPAGDPEAGKAAFEKMECYSCHKVPSGDLPKVRSSGGVGPNLVAGYGKLPAAEHD